MTLSELMQKEGGANLLKCFTYYVIIDNIINQFAFRMPLIFFKALGVDSTDIYCLAEGELHAAKTMLVFSYVCMSSPSRMTGALPGLCNSIYYGSIS